MAKKTLENASSAALNQCSPARAAKTGALLAPRKLAEGKNKAPQGLTSLEPWPLPLKPMQKDLLSWFASQARDLPWRKNRSPYRVWVSEIMLQQTQVATVIPYYERWLETLPSLTSLAKASEETVLKLWEGLGYYRRARMLKQAAEKIVQDHNGNFPNDLDSIRNLPGIGPYTAGAIASIAFDQKVPILDGNVIRILSRLTAFTKDVDTSLAKQQLWAWAEELVPVTNPGLFNESMMELGATICFPTKPLCPECPLKGMCRAFRLNQTEDFPVRKRKKAATSIQSVAGLILHQENILVIQRPSGGLWSDLWELPTYTVNNHASSENALREGLKKMGIHLKTLNPAGVFRRSFTSFREEITVFHTSSVTVENPLEKPSHWADKNKLKQITFSSVYGKILRKAGITS